eukprot:TRINITY_DN3633_c0_g1_i1.p1 TRINITY_DN3633_c0_g1~~TRINITY_DN3633_c0_g1_i1.p1  ORF type:complete len:460 (-),score=89.52 TRINITY_DN3633_c0_g1_i1:110-1489(-)
MCVGQLVHDCNRACGGRGICDKCCTSLSSLCLLNPRQTARFSHFLFYGIILLIIILLIRAVPQVFQPWAGDFLSCPTNPESVGYRCVCLAAIYRASLALVAVFALIFLTTLSRDAGARDCNESCWFIKMLVFIAVFIGLLFVNKDDLIWYVNVARVISVIFFAMLVIMFIDIAYTWGEVWIKRYDEGAQQFKCYLLSATVILYAIVLYLFIRGLIWFSGDGCGGNVAAMVVGLILCLFFTGISISGKVPNGSLLTSAVLSCVVMSFTVAGLSSDNRAACNSLLSGGSTRDIMITEVSVGVFVLFIALIYISLATDTNSSNTLAVMQKLEIKENNGEEAYEEVEYIDENGEKKTKKVPKQPVAPAVDPAAKQKLEEEAEVAPYRGRGFVMFQLIMLLACFYFAMLLTNWDTADKMLVGNEYYYPNDTAYWVKLSAAWFTVLLYIWTMIAPLLFPERNFQR